MGEKGLINVSEFLRQYGSERTKQNYKTGLKIFFGMIYPESKGEDLDILSKRYLAEDRDYRNDVMDFKDSLQNYAPMTISSRLNSIRVFLDENGINFPKRFFKNLNGKVTEAISEEKIPSNEELKRVIEYLPVQGKALALVLSSSGMRIGEALKIKLSDIKLDRDPVRIKIRGEYTKTGKRRITFISPEAKEAVKEWLSYRDQYMERAYNRTQKEFRKSKTDNLFPFTHLNFNQMWHNALGKAKLLERDEKTNRVSLRPHNLRKFFRLRVGRYGRDEAECLMGHQAGLNRIYANFDSAEERLEEVYKKSIPDLSIYQRGVHVAQENKEMKSEIKELKERFDDLRKKELDKEERILYLTVTNAKKTEEIEKNKKEISQLKVNDEKQTKEIEELKRNFQSLDALKLNYERITGYLRSKMNKEMSL